MEMIGGKECRRKTITGTGLLYDWYSDASGILFLVSNLYSEYYLWGTIESDGRGYSSDVSKSGGGDRFPLEPGKGRR